MTRDAELFFLNGIDYTPIKTKIEFEKDAYRLSREIAIFSISEAVDHFIILSISDKVDKIVLENGAILADPKDLYRIVLKNKKLHPWLLVFGEEILLEFLPAVPVAE